MGGPESPRENPILKAARAARAERENPILKAAREAAQKEAAEKSETSSFRSPLRPMTTPAGAAGGGSPTGAEGAVGALREPPQLQEAPSGGAFTPQALTESLRNQGRRLSVMRDGVSERVEVRPEEGGRPLTREEVETGLKQPSVSVRPKELLTNEQRVQIMRERDKLAASVKPETRRAPQLMSATGIAAQGAITPADAPARARLRELDDILARDAEKDPTGNQEVRNFVDSVEREKTRKRNASAMMYSPEGREALVQEADEYDRRMAEKETEDAARASFMDGRMLRKPGPGMLPPQRSDQLPPYVPASQRKEENVFFRYRNVTPFEGGPGIGQLPDPREDKIWSDFEGIAEKTDSRRTQYTKLQREQMQAAKDWAPRNEFEYRRAAYDYQSRLLHGDMLRIKKQLDAGADPKQFAERISNIKDGLEYLSGKYSDLAVLDRPSFKEAVNQLVQAQSEKDPLMGIPYVGAASQAFRGLGVSFMNSARSALAGAARLIDISDSAEYSSLDKFAKAMEDIADQRSATFKKGYKDSTLGKVMEGAGTMAFLIAPSALGQPWIAAAGRASKLGNVAAAASLASKGQKIGEAAAIGTGFAMEYDGFVRQAVNDGASVDVAENAGYLYALVSTAIERGINPQRFFNGKEAAIEPVRKEFIRLLKQGANPRTALRGALEVAESGFKEVIEELMQTMSERGVNMAANAMAGTELNETITAQEAGETALVSMILGTVAEGAFRGATRRSRREARSRAESEAWQWAANNSDEAIKLVDRADLPDAEKEDFRTRVQLLAKKYKANNLNDADPKTAAAIVDAIDEKDRVAKDIKENPMDPALKAAVGDSREQRLADIDEEIVSMATQAQRNELSSVLSLARNAEYINENRLASAENELYELFDDIDSRTDLSAEQKEQMLSTVERSIETLQDYGFRTRTETRTTTQAVATRTPRTDPKKATRGATPVSAAVEGGIPITYDDGSGPKRGVIKKEDGMYVFHQTPMGAVKRFKPVVIGDAAIVDGGVRFAGIENRTTGPVVSVANITLPNGATMSILDDDLSIDAALHVARESLGDVPQNEFDIEFNNIVTENQVEVPYIYEPKGTRQQPKPKTNAVQERAATQVGAQPGRTEGAGQAGRQEVGREVQGGQAPQEGRPQGEVTPTPTTTATGPVRPGAGRAAVAELSRAESRAESNNTLVSRTSKEMVNAILQSDPRLKEVMDNFDRVIAKLEADGKLKQRCP